MSALAQVLWCITLLRLLVLRSGGASRIYDENDFIRSIDCASTAMRSKRLDLDFLSAGVSVSHFQRSRLRCSPDARIMFHQRRRAAHARARDDATALPRCRPELWRRRRPGAGRGDRRDARPGRFEGAPPPRRGTPRQARSGIRFCAPPSGASARRSARYHERARPRVAKIRRRDAPPGEERAHHGAGDLLAEPARARTVPKRFIAAEWRLMAPPRRTTSCATAGPTVRGCAD